MRFDQSTKTRKEDCQDFSESGISLEAYLKENNMGAKETWDSRRITGPRSIEEQSLRNVKVTSVINLLMFNIPDGVENYMIFESFRVYRITL